MTHSLADCADSLEQLRGHFETLGQQLDSLGLPRPDGEPWHELLVRKLLPQLDTFRYRGDEKMTATFLEHALFA